MDKLLARARNAQIQAKRRLDRQLALEKKRKINEIRQEHIMYQQLVTRDRKTSRKEEIEDHRLGPLKPIRAVGQKEISMYGAFDQMRIIPPAVPDEHKIKHWNITVKDRVVVLRGPDRHKIGVVKSVDKDNNTVVVQGLNMVAVKTPEFYFNLHSDVPAVQYRELPMHYDDVRLVVPTVDPVTKELRDTVVANVAMSKIFHDKILKEKRWIRYIKGTSIEIPWPKKEEPEQFDQDCDTRIMHVENDTFVPTLLEAPIPLEIVDEIRNKFSRFRTRHEPEYVAKVEAALGYKERLAREAIKTPLQLLNKKLREEKKAQGKPELTSEILEQLGRAMAKNKPALLERVQAQEQVATA
ncbi:hypothetical protein FPQ18DRAFT_373333 [Pyronema domesticum]|nr:hypothetical protein FPQ18DRAFT_373333 [Pyronema domesticum]